MQLGSVMAIASGGMRVQTDRLAVSAQNVAQASTPVDATDRVSLGSSGSEPAAVSGYDARGAVAGGGPDPAAPGANMDLAAEQVAQMASLQAFQANVAVLRSADDMLGSLVAQRA